MNPRGRDMREHVAALRDEHNLALRKTREPE
jgi:hypothetical protein